MCDWLSIILGALSVVLGGLALFIALKIVNIGNRSAYRKLYISLGKIRFKMLTLQLFYGGTDENEKVRREIYSDIMNLNLLIIDLKGESTEPNEYKKNTMFVRLLNKNEKVEDFINVFDKFAKQLLIANNMDIISSFNDLKEYKIKYKRNWHMMIIGFKEVLIENTTEWLAFSLSKTVIAVEKKSNLTSILAWNDWKSILLFHKILFQNEV